MKNCISFLLILGLNVNLVAKEYSNLSKVVKPSLTIVKIYDVNTINETYQIDGYISFTWYDASMSYLAVGDEKFIVSGKSAMLDTLKFWHPVFEFINVLGQRQTSNFEYIFFSDGTVTYTERFNGSFTSSMDFKKFPFDKQAFEIVVESFDFQIDKLKFSTGTTQIVSEFQSEFWSFQNSQSDTMTYSWDLGDESIDSKNARWVASYTMKRNPGYFYWQFYFPLSLIVFSAWFTFWISSFADRLSMTLSLLIAVIAFNFFTSTLLPELPYTTFIESGILLGYAVIFVSIIFTVFIEWSKKSKQPKLARFLNIHLRWIIPIIFMVALCLIVGYYEVLKG